MRRKALKNSWCALVFSTPNNASSWDIFHIKNNQLIIPYILHHNTFEQPQSILWIHVIILDC